MDSMPRQHRFEMILMDAGTSMPKGTTSRRISKKASGYLDAIRDVFTMQNNTPNDLHRRPGLWTLRHQVSNH